MDMAWHGDIDFLQNKLQNVKIHPAVSAPAGADGQVYVNTVAGANEGIWYYANSAWHHAAGGGGGVGYETLAGSAVEDVFDPGDHISSATKTLLPTLASPYGAWYTNCTIDSAHPAVFEFLLGMTFEFNAAPGDTWGVRSVGRGYFINKGETALDAQIGNFSLGGLYDSDTAYDLRFLTKVYLEERGGYAMTLSDASTPTLLHADMKINASGVQADFTMVSIGGETFSITRVGGIINLWAYMA